MTLILNKNFSVGWLISGLIILLSGCVAVKPEEAEILAARQAEQIRARLPVQSGGYNWVLAENTGIVITITVTSDSAVSSLRARNHFMQKFQQRLCSSPSVRFLLSKQVTYRISMKEGGRLSDTEGVVDNAVCKLLPLKTLTASPFFFLHIRFRTNPPPPEIPKATNEDVYNGLIIPDTLLEI